MKTDVQVLLEMVEGKLRKMSLSAAHCSVRKEVRNGVSSAVTLGGFAAEFKEKKDHQLSIAPKKGVKDLVVVEIWGSGQDIIMISVPENAKVELVETDLRRKILQL